MKATRRASRYAPLLLALAIGVFSAPSLSGQTPAAPLPTPEQFFGFQMGADRKLANWDKLLSYYQALAKSSNRMKLVELGKSSEGRPYIALFISSPANLAKLEQYRQIAVRLADPRGLSEAEAKKLIAEGKAVTIRVVGYEKGGPTAPLEERPAIRYVERVSATRRGGVGEREEGAGGTE